MEWNVKGMEMEFWHHTRGISRLEFCEDFIPRRRYIYICPRVHLILLIFIITMGTQNRVSKIPEVIALF